MVWSRWAGAMLRYNCRLLLERCRLLVWLGCRDELQQSSLEVDSPWDDTIRSKWQFGDESDGFSRAKAWSHRSNHKGHASIGSVSWFWMVINGPGRMMFIFDYCNRYSARKRFVRPKFDPVHSSELIENSLFCIVTTHLFSRYTIAWSRYRIWTLKPMGENIRQ